MDNKKNIFIFILVLLIFLFFIFILLVEYKNLINYKFDLMSEIIKLNNEINSLNNEIFKLKNDKKYIEKIARDSLLMKKDKEKIYTLEGNI